MKATALDAALAALDVACAYLALAEQHARDGHAEADELYRRTRAALVERYRQDRQWLRIERAIKAKLHQERAGDEKGRAA